MTPISLNRTMTSNTPAMLSAGQSRPARLAVSWVVGVVVGVGVLSGCAHTALPSAVNADAPPQWFAALPKESLDTSLPHNASLSSLSQWWQLQNDPLLVELIDAAQRVGPSVIAARANIEQARAARTISGGALLPSLDAVGSVSRASGAAGPQGGGAGGATSASSPSPSSGGSGSGGSGSAVATTAQLGLQASWEIDVFGKV